MRTIKILISIYILSLTNTGFSANEQFRSAVTGDWNANSTWEMSTNSGSSWFPATSTPNDTSGIILIRNLNVVRVTASVNADQLTVQSGSRINIDTMISLTIVAGTGTDLTLDGGGIIDGPGTVETSGDVSLVISSSTGFIAPCRIKSGTASCSESSVFVFNGTLSIDSLATLNISSTGSFILANSNFVNNGLLAGNGRLKANGLSFTNNDSITINNLDFYDTTSVSGTGIFTGVNVTIGNTGNVTLAGNVNYSPTGSFQISGGKLNPNSNTLTFSAGTLSLGSGAIVSNSGTIQTQGTASVIIDNSNLNCLLKVSSGTTTCIERSGSIYGSITVDPAGTLNVSSTGSNITVTNNVTNNGLVTGNGRLVANGPLFTNYDSISINNLDFNDTTSISGTGIFTGVNVTIGNTGNVTLAGNVNYSPTGSFQISGGKLNPNSNTLTFGAGTLSLGSGAIVSNSGTIQTLGSANVIVDNSNLNCLLKVSSGTTTCHERSGSLYGSITVDPTGTLYVANTGSNITVTNNVTNNGLVTGNGKLVANGPLFTNNDSITINNLDFNDTTSISGTGIFTGGNVTINNSGNVSLAGNVSYSPTGSFQISGGKLNPNSNTLTFGAGTLSLGSGAIVSNLGTIQTQGAASVIVDNSNLNCLLKVSSGTTTCHERSGSLYGSITVDPTGTLYVANTGSNITVTNNVTNNGLVTGNGKLVTNGPSFTNNNSITIANLDFNDTTSISGTGIFTGLNVTINNTGNISLSGNVNFSPTGNFQISGGKLNPNNNVLIFSAGTLSLGSGAIVSNLGTIQTQGSANVIVDNSNLNCLLKVSSGTTTCHERSGSLYGSITVDPTGTLYVASTGSNITATNIVINNGIITGNGRFRFSGSSFNNNGNISVPTFHFDTGVHSLSGTGSWSTQANIISGSIVLLTSNHQMSTVDIQTGGILNITSQTLKLSGAGTPLIKSGVLINTNSTIEYNGASSQSLTSNVSYANLTINDSLGVTLPDSFIIPGRISLIKGSLNLNGFNITLTDTASISETAGNTIKGNTGYIIATRNINSPTSLNVAGLGAVLTSQADLGSTTIKREHAVVTVASGKPSIKRFYTITTQNDSGLNATLAFSYDNSELDTLPESSLALYRSTNGGINYTYEGGVVNTLNNQITLSGIHEFSRWTAARTTGASTIDSMIVPAIYSQGVVPIKWRTYDTIGVRIKRTKFFQSDTLPVPLDVRVQVKRRVEPFDERYDDTLHFPEYVGPDSLIYIPLAVGIYPRPDIIIVHAVPGELGPLPENDINTYCWDITADAFNYIDPCNTMDGGAGFTGRKGRMAVEFTNSASEPFPIYAVDHSFFDSSAGSREYRIAIYSDNGNGKPGTPLYISPLLTSPEGTGSAHNTTHEIYPPVSIPALNRFYVGVIQTTTTNIKVSFQNEEPVRANSFFFSNSDTGSAWYDFADSSKNFRLNISPRTSLGLSLRVYLEGFYNGASNLMISDTAIVDVRNFYFPYDVIDRDTAVLNDSGKGNFNFIKLNSDSDYYFAVRHRNHIETWSHATGEKFNVINKSYNFTDSLSKAFGNNMVNVEGRFALYAGDVNQDGIIDASDVSRIDNDATNFATGYVTTDIDGNEFVDATDVAMADNNAFNFIGVVLP